jgi:hypothetical protein
MSLIDLCYISRSRVLEIVVEIVTSSLKGRNVKGTARDSA